MCRIYFEENIIFCLHFESESVWHVDVKAREYFIGK